MKQQQSAKEQQPAQVKRQSSFVFKGWLQVCEETLPKENYDAILRTRQAYQHKHKKAAPGARQPSFDFSQTSKK